MHEWALAEGVIATARKAAEERGIASVRTIRVRMGELQQIDAEIFTFAVRELLAHEDVRVRNASVELETEPAILECRRCGTTWALGDELAKLGEEEAEAIHFVPELAHAYIRCPSCRSPDFRVARGRGVWLAAVEGA